MTTPIHRRLGASLLAAAALLAGAGPGSASAEENVGRPGPRLVAPAAASITGYFAVVDTGGAFVRGKGVVRTAKVGATAGAYEVIFNKAITGCAFTGAVADPDFAGLPPSGEIRLVGRSGTNNGVFVKTSDSAGVAADRPFHVAVTC